MARIMTRRQEAFALLHLLVWTVHWKARGHERNHDPFFCHHWEKVWAWRAADGCTGRVCGFCHLIEQWSPSQLPGVEEPLRTRYNGEPDLEWSLPRGLPNKEAIDRLLSESEVVPAGERYSPSSKIGNALADGPANVAGGGTSFGF